IDGEPMDEALKRQAQLAGGSREFFRELSAATTLLGGAKGSTRKLTIIDHEGVEREVETIPYATIPPSGTAVWVPERQRLKLEPGVVQYQDLGDGIAYVAINSFVGEEAAEKFESLIPQLREARGLIIDLRNNGGGNDNVGLRIIKHFTKDEFVGFAAKTR